MTYSNRFVACLKSGGKILREKDENVYIPFFNEYSILLKNLEGRSASVKIEIDGEDVLDGHSLIVKSNSTFELEGFLKDITAKNRFKFIPKSKEISEFRGYHIDDSIVRVSWCFEKMKPIVQEVKTIHTHDYWPYYQPIWYTTSSPKLTDYTITCNSLDTQLNTSKSLSINDCQQTFMAQSCLMDSFEDGITVKGSCIQQSFQYGYVGELEEVTHVICLRLQGYSEKNEVIEKPLLVSDKLQCKVCGKTSKSDSKFCGNCGTALNY